ncbi:MAG: hypothetical protein K9K63_07670 [Desulfotignum sp.]|nr:hypothetical protein [Desulfotignum sp.]MCF8137173.1 hypothetical protein [Desulfotignum sp.]
MKKTKLPEKYAEQVDVSSLTDIEDKVPDLKKDLHVFVEYVRNRTVKRSVRENKLPKTDLTRLAKLISDPFAPADVAEHGESDWLDFIDHLALQLKFIDYDTQGEYAGYTSYNRSFPDNYIDFNADVYTAFLEKSLQEQEQVVFDCLVDSYANDMNEFYSVNALGRLDRFNFWGCATGVMPFIRFGEARRKVFAHLKNYLPGVWYSTSSLIRRLKHLDPYFLIPEKPRYKYPHDKKKGRYGNFTEIKSDQPHPVKPADPDAFERVEGRYIERLLEYIPLCMGFVELAYGKNLQQGISPSMGRVRGFKVTERFIRFMNGALSEPKVTVLPNHEIHIESDIYPAGMLHRLTPFASLVSEDKICVMRLERQRIIDFMAENDAFNLEKFLNRISPSPLPSNIVAEISEWSGQSDMFVLHEGCGLLEGKKPPEFINDFLKEKISEDICLIRTPETVLDELEIQARAPVEIRHSHAKLSTPPQGITSRFLKKAVKKQKPAAKERVVLKQKTFVTLFFQKPDILETFAKELVREKCPFEVNKETLALSYGTADKKTVASVLKRLRNIYQITIEDLSP